MRYCEVCNKPAKWLWSRKGPLFSSSYCSFTCMATDNVGFNAIFGAIATFGGIMLIESFGFLLLSIGIGMLCMAFYGSAHQKRLGSSPYDYQTATQKETIINYGKFH